MVTAGLKLTGLRAVVGPSMGSFQAIEWGIHYPDFMKGLVLIVPSARSDQRFGAIADAVRATITLDPDYKNGAYETNPKEGLRRAGTIYFPWLYSDAYLRSLGTDASYEKELWAFGDNWARAWDANALLLRFNASRNHDVSKPFNGDMKVALSHVKARTIVIVSETDRTVPGDLSQEIIDGVTDTEWAVIPSIRGHLAGALPLPGSQEEAFLALRIRPFLDRL
jgi:homoserine O-acetyltransferase